MINCDQGFAEKLKELECGLIITTYQANKLFFICSFNGVNIDYYYVEQEKPMGVDVNSGFMAVGNKNAINIYKYKSIIEDDFELKSVYHTGDVDVHDVKLMGDKVMFVNTKYSCLSFVDEVSKVTNVWSPSFLQKCGPFDYCHINGMSRYGLELYVTALGESNEPFGWRDELDAGGVLIRVSDNKVVKRGLAMPHSPRFWNGKLYLLMSANGSLVEFIDESLDKYNEVFKFEGFVRGFDIIKGFAFVGISMQRRANSYFKDLSVAKKADKCGVKVIDIHEKKVCGELFFCRDVEELYEVNVVLLKNNIGGEK